MDNFCGKCNKICVGEVLFAHDEYFHKDCFKCKACLKNLLTSGFFLYENEFYCSNDYQKLFGISCRGCGKMIEGEAVTIMDDSYHQDCFSCARCRVLFPPGAKISFDGNNYLCDTCIQDIENEPQTSTVESTCAGCGNEIKSGQALLALDSQWHLWCFTCHKCGCLLSGEYVGRDGVPYCEKDYQDEFGVTCAGCGGYITGKVLQAGEKHYHPQCSRCAKCNQMFGEGEEMYLQGSEIWHPECSDAYQRDAEENARNAYENSMEEAKPEPRSQPPPVQSKPASPPPVETKKADIGRATRDFMEYSYREPEREERPPEPKPVEPARDETSRVTRNYIERAKEQPMKEQKPPETASDWRRSYQREPLKDDRASPKPDDSLNKRLSSSNDALSTKAYSARPFEAPKTTPGSISINFKPKSTFNTSTKWKPPEPKTAPPTETPPKTTTSLYRPSKTPPATTEPEKTTFKRPEPPKATVKTETTTRYSFKTEEKRSFSPPTTKEETVPPVSNGFQKTPSVSSDEGPPPARPPPPPTRGAASQNWRSRISMSLDDNKRATSPPSTQEAPNENTQPPSASDIDVRSANKPLSYLDSASKRTSYQTETKRTTTNITIKSVSTSSDDAPLPNALYRRTPAANRESARENRKSMPSMPDAVDNKPVVMRENGPARTESKAMNRRSLPSMDKLMDEQARKSYPVYPYSILRSSNYKMPKEIDRSRLEAYLDDEEFEDIFKMEKDSFYTLPAWKQRDLKKKVSLF